MNWRVGWIARLGFETDRQRAPEGGAGQPGRRTEDGLARFKHLVPTSHNLILVRLLLLHLLDNLLHVRPLIGVPLVERQVVLPFLETLPRLAGIVKARVNGEVLFRSGEEKFDGILRRLVGFACDEEFGDRARKLEVALRYEGHRLRRLGRVAGLLRAFLAWGGESGLVGVGRRGRQASGGESDSRGLTTSPACGLDLSVIKGEEENNLLLLRLAFRVLAGSR